MTDWLVHCTDLVRDAQRTLERLYDLPAAEPYDVRLTPPDDPSAIASCTNWLNSTDSLIEIDPAYLGVLTESQVIELCVHESAHGIVHARWLQAGRPNPGGDWFPRGQWDNVNHALRWRQTMSRAGYPNASVEIAGLTYEQCRMAHPEWHEVYCRCNTHVVNSRVLAVLYEYTCNTCGSRLSLTRPEKFTLAPLAPAC